jgi:hypothetical protein
MDITFSLTGTVIEIGEVKILSQYFSKREFKIRYTDTDFKNKIKENKVLLNVQNEDLTLLDMVKLDDLIRIKFYIDGRDIMKKDQSGMINFTTLICYDIEILSSPTRDTNKDRDAVITNEGKIYKDPLVAATMEELAGLVVKKEDGLLDAWDKKKDKYGLIDDGKGGNIAVIPQDNPFGDIKENETNKPLPF